MALKKKAAKNGRKTVNAIALLRDDHAEVKALFSQFEKTRKGDRKAARAARICMELTVHAQIEEEIFYPAAREVLRQEDLIDEAAVEHDSAKHLIAQIESSSPGDHLFDAKVKVLGEYINHHVKEEQNEMFPKIRRTSIDLTELGQRLMARKHELLASKHESAV